MAILTKQEREEIREALINGVPPSKLAEEYKVSTPTIYGHLGRLKKKGLIPRSNNHPPTPEELVESPLSVPKIDVMANEISVTDILRVKQNGLIERVSKLEARRQELQDLITRIDAETTQRYKDMEVLDRAIALMEESEA